MTEEKASYNTGQQDDLAADRAHRDKIWEIMALVQELLGAEGREAALYAGVRNRLRDAAEDLSEAAGLYLEAIRERQGPDE